MKKKFYAILLTALMLFSVGCGAAMATTDEVVSIVNPSNLNIAELYASQDNKFFYSGNAVTSADWRPNNYLYKIIATSPDATLELRGEITPKDPDSGLKWSFDRRPVSGDNNKVEVIGWLEGTVSSADTLKTDRTYTLTVLPYRGGKEITQSTYPNSATIAINIKPTIKATNLEENKIVWGKEWSFTPSLDIANINDATWEVVKSGDSLISHDAIGLSFDRNSGKLSGTWEPTRAKLNTGSGDIILGSGDWDLQDVSKDIFLKVTRGSGDKAVNDEEKFTLWFTAGGPVIVSTDKETPLTSDDITKQFATVSTDTRGFMWNEPITSGEGVVVVAYGPGLISWDVNGYILTSDDFVKSDDTYGFTYEAVMSDDNTSKLYIYGTPTTTAENATIKITAANAKGSETRTATFSIGADKFTLRAVNHSQDNDKDTSVAALPSDDVKVNDTVAPLILIAQPGPVSWDTENLPDGLELKDLGNGYASISGKFTTGMTDKDGVTYQIIATNPLIDSSDILSTDIRVWDKPEVYDGVIDSTIVTKTEYEWILDGTNFPNANSWDIKIDGLEETTTGKKWNVKDGTSNISLDIVSEDGGYKAKLVGSIDRVPDGAKFTVALTAKNFYGESDKKTFTVTVAGVAPKMTAQSFVLSDNTSKTISVTAGDAPLEMTATISDRTALAAFGTSEITLGTTKDENTGLSFSFDVKGNAYLSYDAPANGVAYNNLPVTITATNTADNNLKATVTHKVTVTGTSPTFNNSNDITKTYCDILGANVEVPAAVTLTVPAGKALPEDGTGIVFNIVGANPLNTAIKPASANGITPELTSNDRLLTFTGTPIAAKKDVTSKFTITTTNPLTKISKKIVVTVVAKPTPVIDTSKGLEKEVLVGKKVKITPKAIVTTTGMKWKIDKVSGGNPNGGGTVDSEKALLNQYGLEFDVAKGTISGTALYPTGKDAPILVEFYAYGGTVSSDTATATITILGAKPKLVTKKMSLVTTDTVDKTGTNAGVVYTNMSDANEGATSGHMKANVELTATTPLPDGVSITNGSNKPTLTGKATKATKKLATEFKLTNFGTEGKGKITFMVTDSQPVIEAVSTTPITVDPGSSTTATLKVKDSTNSDLKYKWKITAKPSVAGVSAKIKGNGKYATVTVKANKKVAEKDATVGITVTDPLTKASSTEFPLKIAINLVTNTSDTELEAGETKAETKAEAKDIAAVEKEVKDVALGEGEVHMGAGRTADKLTAAQRKAIEDKGYVIAAVLPEIEVTASGQYDFEVDLDKEVKTGAELVWFAFSTKPTTDDEIVDFADEKGEETKVVPESHVVIVAPWLNAEAKYAPVIAVKADAKDADATTAEGVKEAAEAKTEE